MSENQKLFEKNEVEQLSHEMTYRNYLMNRGRVRELFRQITIPEYVALHMIASEHISSSDCSERTYLKDLASKMQLTIRHASKMVERLADRGLILWSHDGNGSEGTYVIITETGLRLLDEQEAVLKDFYGNVIEKFGKKKFVELLQMMKQLDDVMSEEIEGR